MYNVSETVLPIYINGQCPIIKTCSDVTLNLSSKDYTPLVQECPKIHKDHTATVQSHHGCRAISMHGCVDSNISIRTPHGLSTALYRSLVETCQRNRTMAA